MERGSSNRGYTIVEVMLFLAISGVMFVIAAGFVTGKQAKAEFKQGTNSINSEIRRVINDVSNGYFPATNTFSCSANDGGSPPDILAPVSGSKQGNNKGCVFIGKAIQFGVKDTDGKGYNIYTVAGRQFKGTPKEAQIPAGFGEVKPVVVHNSSLTPPVDLTEHQTLDWGLKASGMFNGSMAINGVGFFSSFVQSPGGTPESGSQSISVVPLGSSAPGLNMTEAVMRDVIKAISDGDEEASPNITVCFEGGFNQYAALTIGGGSGQRLTTTIKVSNEKQGICNTV